MEIYEGEFFHDSINGKGKMQYPDGTEYKGTFKNEKKEGFGKYTTQEGKVISGLFENDKLVDNNPVLYK